MRDVTIGRYLRVIQRSECLDTEEEVMESVISYVLRTKGSDWLASVIESTKQKVF